MNKKNLSVVMAGAMLATSVAPVLADTASVKEYKLADGQEGLLMEGLRNKMKEKTFEAGSKAGKSVYAFTVTSTADATEDTNLRSDLSDIETYLKSLSEGNVVRVYEQQYDTDSYGRITSQAQKDGVGTPVTIKDKSELVTIKSTVDSAISTNKLLKKAELNAAGTELVVTLNAVEDVNAAELTYKTIKLTVGSEKPNWAKPLDADGKPLDPTKEDDVQKFAKFESQYSGTVSAGAELTGKTKLAEIKIVKADDGSVADNYLVSDLFDGLLLTEKGKEIFNTIKDDEVGKGIDYEVTSLVSANGIHSFEVKYKDTQNSNKVIRTITVRGTEKEDAEILQSYLDKKKASVDVLAGANRYETAAKIAKEQAELTSVAANGHVVLVNGYALVDGLAAAPLAKTLGSTNAAPILLTEADSLPTATKAYLKELVKGLTLTEIENITIDLVGGESVLTNSLVKELEGYGFKVKRYGGDNREETSLEVARAIAKTAAPDNVYVVGAEGEADAMSIAPVASSGKDPIIVSSYKGLSKEALREIEDLSNANVTVIGGTKAVNEDIEKDLRKIQEEKTAKTFKRIAGDNRKDTNAAIMKEYYSFADAVVVAKDGQNNKYDLVDALTAANLAAEKNAPIVLATDKLSDSQINQLNLKAQNANAVYQVGYNVNTNVVEKVANLLGLPKKIS